MSRERIKRLALFMVGILPASAGKNLLLGALGNSVGSNCSVGIILLVGTTEFSFGDNTRISNFNVFRDLSLVTLGANSTIGSWNWFSAAREFGREGERATLRLGCNSAITGRHYLDCSGGVNIGDFTTVAGNRSTILTHGIDLERNVQTVAGVEVGDYCFVSTGCTLLKGSALPSKSVLAAGAVLIPKNTAGVPGLWAGVPAVRKGDVSGLYFERQNGRVSVDPHG